MFLSPKFLKREKFCMKKKRKESKYYEDWLTKAKRDLDDAVVGHHHGIHTDTTCYFGHQVGEKALKSYLLYKGLKFLPHIHILPALLSMCEEKDKNFAKLKKHCLILNKYYIETKYPLSHQLTIPNKKPKKQSIWLQKFWFL